MYPRNAASPPRIAIGAVIQISDGAVQSSGVSVVVRPEGGSETAGGGTVSYGASSNVVYYAPTQAETNYTAFVVTAYKTGCVPVSKTVITTESATAGRAYLAAGDVSGNLPVNIKAVSDDTTAADNLEAAADGTGYNLGGGQIVAASVTDKTNFALTSAYDAAKTAASQSSVNTVGSSVDAVGVLATSINNKTTNLPASPAAVGSAMTLTSGERTAVANEVEAQIIDDTDTEKVLEAITNKIAAANPDLSGLTLSAIGVAVRDALLNRVLAGNHDTAGTPGKLLQSITEARLAELDQANLPTDVAAIPTSNPSASAIRQEIDANSTRLAEIVADTNELQADWADGGRLDALLDGTKERTDNLPDSPAAVGSAMTLTSAYDLYHADIDFTRDEANTQDEYTVAWFKNGVAVTSGITSPTIQVVKRADGANLIASNAMTQIGSTGMYKYDATGVSRQSGGEAVVVVATATIDGSARSFRRVLGRDSEAAA